MDLSQLLEARKGRPTEHVAARKIATFAVIPAATIGLLAGTQLVGLADPIGRLLWICAATTLGSGFGIAFLVLGIYSLFGFRPVAVFADALVGGFVGFLCGATLTLLLMWFQIVNHNLALWALLLSPFGAVAVAVYQARNDSMTVSQPPEVTNEKEESSTSNVRTDQFGPDSR